MTTHFFARLTGKREIPPVNTEAYGVAEFIFSEDLTKLHYRVILKNIEKVTSCQIHLGKTSQIGPVVFYLYGPLEQGISLNEGSITGVVNVEEFEGPLQGRAFDSLLQEIIQANVYVNVYTKSNKKGEIRGRIRKVKK
ncbi:MULTISPECIES: exosporium regulatory protein ExsM [Bacillus cereus group]|uniref:exosporium regulatory protein ExsM n=1 Tax=Bacillus cereus group TaxID=86661 RepID=UPI000313D23D|nr:MULTISPECIES: exosporium regulatory protein ExsM [Bacillus cereus group]MBR9656104.1 CHRD domain-containing protein [Bacillus cereus]MCU5439376.1 CHRD domain-containing protein [Bacillus cereus]MCU5443184.1 CHRD domain-containing protein [Bacillus cereus]MEC4694235.1 exosporium regulatory protein ExsM [Bacillus anthracis]OKA28746.1 CHRD domain-containing protein [Bacillus cereus]